MLTDLEFLQAHCMSVAATSKRLHRAQLALLALLHVRTEANPALGHVTDELMRRFCLYPAYLFKGFMGTASQFRFHQ